MSQLSLQERLARYLKARPGVWIAKGTMEDLARERMGKTGESTGRRLRILAEASSMTEFVASRTSPEHVKALELLDGGMVKVEHRQKNHAWYCYEPPKTRKVRRVVVEDGMAREVIETIHV